MSDWFRKLVTKAIRIGGTEQLNRSALNLVAGDGVELTVQDRVVDDETRVTIRSTATGLTPTSAYTTLANPTDSSAVPVETPIREIGGIINVRHYGASPSASTSVNNAAFAAAFAAALAGSGELYIPAGEYAVTATLTLTATSITIFGDGSRSRVVYQGGGSWIERESPLTYVNTAIRDLRISGTASGFSGIDLRGTSNATNILIEGVRIDGFSGTGAAGIVADNLYSSQIRNCIILNNYDGIRFGVACIGNTIGPRNFVRGWTRYGVAIIGESLNPAFENNVVENIVDEPVSSTGTAGVYLTFCNVTSVNGNHFEALAKAVEIGSTGTSILNTVDRNMFSNGLTTTVETGAGASNTTIRANRVLSGAFTDNGVSTRFDGQESGLTAAGGYGNTRVGWYPNSGHWSPVGLGIDGADKALRNAAIGGRQVVTTITATGFPATRNQVHLAPETSPTHVYGTSSTTTLPAGGLLYLTTNGNARIWHGRSEDFNSHFLLLDKASSSEWIQPADGDISVFLRLSDGRWREVYRFAAATGSGKWQQVSTGRLALTAYTVATVPSAATYSGQLIRVTDGDDGAPCLAYSNGTDWLRIPLGAAVSAT